MATEVAPKPGVYLYNDNKSFDNISNNAGLYVHIPFCKKKCGYCNFYSTTNLLLKKKFLQTLFMEMEQYRGCDLIFDTIYFGGGTPSILTAEEISSILDKIHRLFRVHEDVEITLEANPGTVGYKNFCQYAHAGINRLNFGIQSFDDSNLKFLGRIHSSRDARLAINLARDAGFSNIGFDMMYGLAEQSLEKWQKDLETALSFFPEHLSCYMLSYEKNTPLYESRKNGDILPLNDDLEGNLFSFTWQFLLSQNYVPYEISNFSRRDPETSGKYRSRHNQKYWHFAPYLGFGPSSHSYVDPVRFWNHKSLYGYMHAVESRRSPVETREILSTEQQMIESIFLGLRTSEGIDIKRFEQKFGAGFFQLLPALLEGMADKGYVYLSDTRCALTAPGMRFHDSICDLIVGAL